MDGGPETVRGASADETVVVPRVAQAAELAWSQDFPSETVPAEESPSWREAWGNAAVLLLVGTVTAFVVGVVTWVSMGNPDTRPVGDPRPAAPTTAALTEADHRFLEAVERATGVSPQSDPETSLYSAHSVCVALQRGDSRFAVNDEMHQRNPDYSWGMLSDFIDLAVQFYCPQYQVG